MATSYYGTDPKPIVCGGTPRRTSSGPLASYTTRASITDQMLAQLDYENAVLDQKLRIRIIVLSIIGGIVVLAFIFGIFLVIRRRRKQRQLANAGIVNQYPTQTNPAQTQGQNPAVEGGNVGEAQKGTARWIFRT
jgi:hypothetical protein